MLRLIIALGAYCASAAAPDLGIDHVTIVSPERPSLMMVERRGTELLD